MTTENPKSKKKPEGPAEVRGVPEIVAPEAIGGAGYRVVIDVPFVVSPAWPFRRLDGHLRPRQAAALRNIFDAMAAQRVKHAGREMQYPVDCLRVILDGAADQMGLGPNGEPAAK